MTLICFQGLQKSLKVTYFCNTYNWSSKYRIHSFTSIKLVKPVFGTLFGIQQIVMLDPVFYFHLRFCILWRWGRRCVGVGGEGWGGGCRGCRGCIFNIAEFENSDVIIPVSILRKSISGRHRPVRVADGPMTSRCRFT